MANIFALIVALVFSSFAQAEVRSASLDVLTGNRGEVLIYIKGEAGEQMFNQLKALGHPEVTDECGTRVVDATGFRCEKLLANSFVCGAVITGEIIQPNGSSCDGPSIGVRN